MSFVAELRRRNVFRVAVLYLVAGWLTLQVADLLGPVFGVPDWTIRVVLLMLVLGFPLALIFSWIYELTPEGLKRESAVDRDASITDATGRRINLLIAGLLALAVVAVGVDRLIPEQGTASSERDSSPAAPVAPAASALPSVAVLPFVNMSADPDNEYFSDGLSEELLNLLAQIPELHVAARTSSFSFKDKEVTIPEIGKALHVDHVLEGSVRKSGNRVRIAAQLIEADKGRHLWSQAYDRELDDIFAVQDEIAAAVVSELKVNLLGTPAPEARPTDPEAYALYLRARYFFERGTSEDLERAVDDYRRVLEMDADYAPAWAGLAASYVQQAAFPQVTAKDAFEKAQAAAERALALDPELAAAHSAVAEVYRAYDWDWSRADESLRRARELAPNDARILSLSSANALTLGRSEEAVAFAQQAIARNPLQVSAHSYLSIALWYAGRLEEAEEAMRQGLELNPDRPTIRALIGLYAIGRGDAQAGLAYVEAEPSPFWRPFALSCAYHALGRQAESDAALAELKEKFEDEGPYQIAEIHAFRGEVDEAFAWLDRAYAQRDSGLVDMKGDPLLANLEDDPRYDALLKKMNLPVD